MTARPAPAGLDEALEIARQIVEHDEGPDWRGRARSDALTGALAAALGGGRAKADALSERQSPSDTRKAAPDARARVSTKSRWTGVRAPAPRGPAPQGPTPEPARLARPSRGLARLAGAGKATTPGVKIRSASERLADMARAALTDNLAGEPLRIEPLYDATVAFRATVAIWEETPSGSADAEPGTVQDPRSLAAAIEHLVRTDPWRILSARQGRLRLEGPNTPSGEESRADIDHEICFALHLAAEETDAAALSAMAAIERHFDILAARRGFAPRLAGIVAEQGVWRAIFDSEAPVASVRLEIGRRTPRIRRDLLALGAPLALASEEPLIDELHDRALDGATLSLEAHADQLAESAAGRSALASAASAEPRQRFIEARRDQAPWLSERGAGRLHDLAMRCHSALGLRMRRWLWPAAAFAAPLLAATLAATAAFHSDVVLRLGRDGAVGLASLISVFGWGPPTAERTTAAIFAGLLPFALFWAVTLGALASAFGRRTKRVLGFARSLTMRDIFARGAGPWAAMTAGAALYAVTFFGLSLGLSEAGFGAHPAAIATTAVPAPANTLPVAAASTPGAHWWAPDWIVERGEARAYDEMGLAVLSARCAAGVGGLRLTPEAVQKRDANGGLLQAGVSATIVGAEWAAVLIDGRSAQVEVVEAEHDGALIWPLPPQLIEQMRDGETLSLDLIDAAGQPVAGFTFSLKGSGAAIDQAIPACRLP